MLTEDGFLPPLVQLSKPAALLTSIGFYWCPVTSQMFKLNPRSYLIHRITTKIHLMAIVSVLLQTALFKDRTLSKMMISSFGLIVIIFCGITVQIYHRNLYKCIALINELVSTSSDLREKGKLVLDTKEKFIKLLAPTLHWSAMSVPFAFIGGVVFTMPCMPSNLGYFLLNECSDVGANGNFSSYPCPYPCLKRKVAKAFFLLSNFWLWSYGVQCAVFVVVVVMLGAMSIRSFLKFYERKMVQITSISGKKVLSKNDCKNESIYLLRIILLYRRLQLLTDRFNKIHQAKILVPLLFTVTSHQVFSVYGAIKFKGDLNFASYALFGILGSQGILVIMGMFTGLADVFTMSKRVKSNLDKRHHNHKFLRRFHLSCSMIKIRFGSLNYVDSFTPLAFENFALVQATNMLMVD